MSEVKYFDKAPTVEELQSALKGGINTAKENAAKSPETFEGRLAASGVGNNSERFSRGSGEQPKPIMRANNGWDVIQDRMNIIQGLVDQIGNSLTASPADKSKLKIALVTVPDASVIMLSPKAATNLAIPMTNGLRPGGPAVPVPAGFVKEAIGARAPTAAAWKINPNTPRG